MRKDRYTLICDGEVIWTSNSIKRCKEYGDYYLANMGYIFAKIMCYNKIYSFRSDDSKWSR